MLWVSLFERNGNLSILLCIWCTGLSLYSLSMALFTIQWIFNNNMVSLPTIDYWVWCWIFMVNSTLFLLYEFVFKKKNIIFLIYGIPCWYWYWHSYLYSGIRIIRKSLLNNNISAYYTKTIVSRDWIRYDLG